MLQELPFQCSASVWIPQQSPPTAQTSFAASASTSFSEFPAHWMFPSSQSGTGDGTGTDVQLVPSQCSASGSLLVNVACAPTAQASRSVRAESAQTMLPQPPGFGQIGRASCRERG